MKIGLVGAGKMGSGMARNLLRAGHQVTVYNRTREKAEALQKDGARVADSPAATCKNADAVFTILSDDYAVDDVVFSDSGIASALQSGAAHISSSTISTALARRLAKEHENRGQVFVTANVFGRPEAAEKKQLIVVAAGEAAVIERLRTVFDAIGRKTFIAGSQPWEANAMKLCGNFMIASMLETFGEAFTVLRKAGVEHHVFLEIMNELFASPVYKNYGQIVADEKFEPPGFELKLGLKDIRLAIAAAEEFEVAMPFGSVIRDHLLSAMANGQEHLDWSSISRVNARNAGIDSGEQKAAEA